MNFHEYQAKELVAGFGIPVPAGRVALLIEAAMAFGTGVTTFTHWLDSHGVSTGTGTMTRRANPATAA